MFRVFHVLITVLGMILCPFACAADLGGVKAGGRGAQARQEPTCSCCQHRAGSTDQKQSPDSRKGRGSQSGCGCTCLCKGALKSDQGASVGAVFDASSVPLAPPVHLNDTSCTEASASWLLGGPPASYPVGRTARLVYQSLLC